MFLIKDAFATVWSVEDKNTYVQGRISTSEKDKEGKYVNSNWNVRFVGKAKNDAVSLSQKDRIKILSGKITNTLYGEGENKKTFLSVIIFDFEMLSGGNASAKPSTQNKSYEDDDSDLPF